MRWCLSVSLLLLVLAGRSGAAEPRTDTPADEQPAAAETFVNVTVQGRIDHGVVAIGAETTGTTITAGNIVYELELPTKRLKEMAMQFDRQMAAVSGRLTRVQGVEVPQRWIVAVTTIKKPR